MKTYDSTLAQDKFGKMMKDCWSEPVEIKMHGKPYAVVLSLTDYNRLKDIENNFLGKLAFVAESCGFMDDEEMNRWIEDKIRASSQS